jgi:hypothetical protein
MNREINKILFVGPHYDEEDGLGVYTKDLIEGFPEDIEVRWVSDTDEADYNLDYSSPLLFQKLKKAIQDFSPDVVHYQHDRYQYGLLRGLQVPYFEDALNIATMHEPDSDVPYNFFSVNSRVIDLAQSNLIQKMDQVIVHLNYNKSRLEEKYSAENISMIRHGVKNLDKEVSDYNYSGIFFGFMDSRKDLTPVLNTAEENPEYKFLIAGKASKGYLKPYKERIEELENIDLDEGWKSEEEKKDILNNTAVVFLPYNLCKSSSGVMSESIAIERPMVATPLPPFNETISEKLGKVVQKNRFPEVFSEVLENKDEYIENLKDHKRENSWSKIAERHLELYKDKV